MFGSKHENPMLATANEIVYSRAVKERNILSI